MPDRDSTTCVSRFGRLNRKPRSTGSPPFPQPRVLNCPSCGAEFPFVTAFVTRDGSAMAVVDFVVTTEPTVSGSVYGSPST